jgi:hypothetical protein
VALSKHEVPVPDLPQRVGPIAAFTFDPQQNRPDIAAIYFCHGGNVVLTREKLLKRLEACKRRIGSAEIDIMQQRALIARNGRDWRERRAGQEGPGHIRGIIGGASRVAENDSAGIGQAFADRHSLSKGTVRPISDLCLYGPSLLANRQKDLESPRSQIRRTFEHT